MKYPFSPEVLDAMPEPLAELFRELELFLLGEICDRLNLADKLNEVTVQDIRVLRSHGIDLDAIKKAIAETANVGLDKVDKLLDDVVVRNQQYFQGMADLASVTAPQRLIDPGDTDAILRQTKDKFRNLTQNLGFLVHQGGSLVMLEPAQAYQWALDQAEMKILSGGVSYNRAIRDAVKELADSGIRVVDYESGHRDHADVAARRAIMTGVNQICDKYAEQSAEYLGTEHYEISAHVGARDVDGPNGWENHKAWQGKVYSVRSFDKYPNIYEVCGLGDVTGLNGANCRHKRFPFIDGVSERTWTDKQLTHIDDGYGCTFEGREYTAYQATQKQRMIERTVRKLKREKLAFEKAGLTEDAQDTNVRIRRLNGLYKDFSKAANLPEQRERLQVQFIDKASEIKANQLQQKTAKKIAAQWNIPEEYVTIEQGHIFRVKAPVSDLANGLPFKARPGMIADKTDENGTVMQRRIYGSNGKASVDFDTTDHNMPSAHPTGAHKHKFDYRRKNPHGKPLPLTDEELEANSDIIQRGVNYHDPK